VSHFLIVYDRGRGTLVSSQRFEDADAALRARFKVERNRAAHAMDYEVVVLSGESEESLRKTHARYFKSASELASAS
jgi:hypothetical protein